MKMIKTLSLTLAVAIALSGMSFATAKTETPAVNETTTLAVNKVITNSNTSNSIKIGKSMEVLIPENATTGYTWTIEVVGSKKVISYTFEKANKDATPTMPGQGLDKILKIKALKKGSVVVKMSLSRPWEKKTAPIEIREYVVNVK